MDEKEVGFNFNHNLVKKTRPKTTTEGGSKFGK